MRRSFPSPGTPPEKRMRYYPGVSPAIPHTRAGCSRVTHPFAGYPLRDPRDLHVLSTPPAFVLSQDQTLQWIVRCSSIGTTLSALSHRQRVRITYVVESNSPRHAQRASVRRVRLAHLRFRLRLSISFGAASAAAFHITRTCLVSQVAFDQFSAPIRVAVDGLGRPPSPRSPTHRTAFRRAPGRAF